MTSREPCLGFLGNTCSKDSSVEVGGPSHCGRMDSETFCTAHLAERDTLMSCSKSGGTQALSSRDNAHTCTQGSNLHRRFEYSVWFPNCCTGYSRTRRDAVVVCSLASCVRIHIGLFSVLCRWRDTRLSWSGTYKNHHLRSFCRARALTAQSENEQMHTYLHSRTDRLCQERCYRILSYTSLDGRTPRHGCDIYCTRIR